MNVSRSSLLPYSAQQMYDIITDIQSYPDFLNWCNGAEIKSESEGEVVAKLLISYGKLNFNFTTRNLMEIDRSVKMSLVDGPFSALGGQWQIQKLSEDACKVSLDMDFNFESTITQALFGRVFQSVIAAQLDAFQKQAEHLYGTDV